MKTGRFFVTSVVLFAIAAGVASCKEPSHREMTAEDNGAVASKTSAEAKELLEQARSIHLSLASKYKLYIASETKIERRTNTVLHNRDFVTNFNFKSVRFDQRQEIKAKINLFVDLVTRLQALNDEKTDREQVEMWLESGRMFQQSLATFEATYGANYDPKEDAQPQPPGPGGKSSRDGIDI